MDEAERLAPPERERWLRWGPYLSERAWGTVREDYSADGDAWRYLPHDQARSRAYRWGEDGLGGISDADQHLCLAFAFWNTRDAILKERIFGLDGWQGNHGEDAKEYWWYLDSTPSHSWMRWRYMYPQAAFPYGDLVAENGRRNRDVPEYELVDTGVFDGGRYWEITADYAKASPDDMCIRLTARNMGDGPATLHVLPTLWYRNRWTWYPDVVPPVVAARPGSPVCLVAADAADAAGAGGRVLAGDGAPRTLICQNETNTARLYGDPLPAGVRWPKDGIGDHVVSGAGTVNPDGTGTKGALHYELQVPAGGSATVRLRFLPDGTAPDLGAGWEQVMRERQAEADAYYAGLLGDAPPDEAAVARQGCAGMLWGKQFFHYSVDEWLDGDATQPAPPPARLSGRNSGWRHVDCHEIISMPDKWEYPWFAAWDLAFQCVVLAHLDPAFAKEQLVLLCREWYQHPNGQLPAYEWNFGDVNPPVHAWAALRVFEIDGARDHEFLERVMHKLLLNFTWWVNRKDSDGSNVFEGGFLGLDNIGPIDRSAALPEGGRLEQSDGTAWMATYCLNLLEMALILAAHDPVYEDLATKFFEHFAYIAAAMNDKGLWNEQDGFFYDLLNLEGSTIPLRVRSMVGLVPLFAVTVIEQETLDRLPDFTARLHWFLGNRPHLAEAVSHMHAGDVEGRLLLSVVSPDRLRRLMATVLDEGEFLSPFGLRSVSAYHRDHPFVLDAGPLQGQVDYEPAESRTPLFGGNSNWRGPVWVPPNYLVIESLRRFHRYVGSDFYIEDPSGSRHDLNLQAVADDLGRRLVSLFLRGPDGRRAVLGTYRLFQEDPAWRDLLPFPEYFHGDTGAGLGASHQTGWTGLVADLVLDRYGAGHQAAPAEGHSASPTGRPSTI